VESAAAADRAASKAAANAPGAEAALSPELPKEPGGGADGMAEDAEEIPGRPEVLKTRGGSLSSEGANAAAQAERSTPIKLHMKLLHSFYHRSSSSWQYTRIVQFLNLHQ